MARHWSNHNPGIATVREKSTPPVTRIGIVGTGFVSRHFVRHLAHVADYAASKVLTRRGLSECGEYPCPELLTNNVDELIAQSDIVLECSGDVIHATSVVEAVMSAGLPVVTYNAELHVTTGSYFVDKGRISEAEGDQPGSLAALKEEAEAMGFRPIAYVNMKQFLNHYPTIKEMRYWGKRNGIRLSKVTSFTDGTKLNIEQALVANGCGATVAQPGMLGPEIDDINEAAAFFGTQFDQTGQPISDYILSPGASHGIFIVAGHDEAESDCLRYLKKGDGPWYTLQRPDVLLHLEIMKTIRRVYEQGRTLLTNSADPQVGVIAIAKHRLDRGTRITQGIGSFQVRGIAARLDEYPDCVPIGLLSAAVVTRSVEPGQPVTFADVELPESRALEICLALRSRALSDDSEVAGSVIAAPDDRLVLQQ